MTVHPLDFNANSANFDQNNVPQDSPDMQYRPNFQDIPDQEEVDFRPFQHPASPSILYQTKVDPDIANKLREYEGYLTQLNRIATTGIAETIPIKGQILTISRRDL